MHLKATSLLDAYITQSFEADGHLLIFNLVDLLRWGEATFLPIGMNGLQMNLTLENCAPGLVKEALIPTETLSVLGLEDGTVLSSIINLLMT